VIHVAIEDIGHIQTGNSSIIAEDAKIGVGGNIASLEKLLG